MASFIIRNPLLPVEQFFNWTSLSGTDTDQAKEKLLLALHDFYTQPVVQEALYIASPDLHEQMKLWLENKIDKADKKEKTELSLTKYMIRMCTRSTPYGLFASCTSGILSDHTSISLQDKHSIQRHGRLDMDYSGQVLTHLLSIPEISDQLVFYPNTSLYTLGESYRYIEHRFTQESGRSYHLVQIPRSVYLDKILEHAQAGKSTADLTACITDHEISKEEAGGFVQELILNQVLISDLEPNVTGEEYFHVLIQKLKGLRNTQDYIKQFERVISEFEHIRNAPGDKNEYYRLIADHLKKLEISVHLKTLIQVDSYRPAASATLNKSVCDDMLYAAGIIQLLSPESRINDAFVEFKNSFIARYESQWIPLVEVLDTESGIGYGKFSTSGMEESPLIDKLPIGNGYTMSETTEVSDAAKFKWKIYQEVLKTGKTEIVIDDKTIEDLAKGEQTPDGLADSAYLMAKIVAASSAEIDQGNYKMILHAPSGPSGANLLGRFCHLNPEIEKLARDILQQEEKHDTDSVYAEIVHLPESRVGNILMRPILRKYEIPYLCGSSLDKEFQIPVTDLMVGIQNNKVVLWSNRLNRQVKPRMTTAHNYSNTTLPIYHFLCELQYQQIRHYGWRWGVLENRPFLPRISYGKFIFSKAKWTLTKEECIEMEKKGDALQFAKFQELAQSRNLPRFFLLSQGDNELLLDSTNILCIKLLLAEVFKYHSVLLTETFEQPGQCWMISPDGHHTGEFLMAFNKLSRPDSEQVSTGSMEQTGPKSDRYFPVGSSWLYAKIYCGTKTAEKILAETIRPFTQQLITDGIVDQYFFLRYNDNGNHIRIRFHHGERTGFWKEVIAGLYQCMTPYMVNHTVHNIQFETYQRELERYGAETMDIAETIFYYQSDAILNFIALLDGDEGEQYRWQVALKAIDLFLDGFRYTLLQKRDLMKRLHTGFSSEFNISGPQQKKISERFSHNKKLIQHLMSDAWQENENLKQAITLFKMEHQEYQKCIEQLWNSASVNKDINNLNDLMASYLHMFINRLFISNQRKVELVLYDYLLKFYESLVAREKNRIPDLLAKSQSADL